jgi:hypothetical protein
MLRKEQSWPPLAVTANRARLQTAGTMQFGRRRDNDARPPVVDRSGHAVIAMNGKGWVCDADPNHFRQEG